MAAPGKRGRFIAGLVTVVVTFFLVLIESQVNPVIGLLGAVLAIGVIAVGTLGLMRAGLACLTVAFATAPMYGSSALDSLTGGTIKPTDLFLGLAVFLIVPVLTKRQLGLPSPYVGGLVVVALFGLASTLVTASVLDNFFRLVEWLFFLGGLPALIAWMRPDMRTIVRLLWAYQIGQVLSTLYALASGPVANNRYQGLSHHPNAFGMAGMTAIAILFFLVPRYKNVPMRMVLVGLGLIDVFAIVLSGSRAAAIVAAALVITVPIVERSAISSVLVAMVGAGGLAVVAVLVGGGSSSNSGGDQSALARLTGNGTADFSNSQRTEGLHDGIRQLLHSPFIGSGLPNIETIQSVFLEVGVAIGVFGLAAYVIVMATFARPLFTDHPLRRLAYLPWGFIGICWALPNLWDRTMWVPICLAILPTLKGTENIVWDERAERADDADASGEPVAATV